MKFRHENPFAESRIRSLDLPRWQSASELEAERRATAARAKRAAELAAVNWSELSPAELAFRWLLDRYRPDKQSAYADWAAGVRSEWLARGAASGCDECHRLLCATLGRLKTR